MMKASDVLLVAVIAWGIAAWWRSSKPGYRGAIGFKNNSASDLDLVQLTGFSKPIECRSLARGEHSFNFLGRQDLPPEVKLTWWLSGDKADKSAVVSLATVPANLRDGEIFFVISVDGAWTVEHATELQLEKLHGGE